MVAIPESNLPLQLIHRQNAVPQQGYILHKAIYIHMKDRNQNDWWKRTCLWFVCDAYCALTVSSAAAVSVFVQLLQLKRVRFTTFISVASDQILLRAMIEVNLTLFDTQLSMW